MTVTEIAATAEVMIVAVKQVNSCYNSSTAEGAVCSSGSNYVSTVMVPIFEIFAFFIFYNGSSVRGSCSNIFGTSGSINTCSL